MSNVPSGKFMLLNKLNTCKAGDSVRVVGMWKSYDKEKTIALLSYKDSNAEVSLTLTDNELPREGDTVQCIGEVMEEELFGIARIQARTIRVVNTLDMDLYERVLMLRNKHS
ncbi:hypothetical protein K501DRAFT_260227 [Backusella circina FSU 941]|nr:hypothetical protein K501DRAFT_260227 [Backusella circina FSU 941]